MHSFRKGLKSFDQFLQGLITAKHVILSGFVKYITEKKEQRTPPGSKTCLEGFYSKR